MGFLNSQNPTKLRVGASGSLEGGACKVLGRVVLSTADGYKWQEYRLQFDDGREATLVYESGDWKIFRMFDPVTPLTAEEADRVRADETVTIDGRTVTVTYVGKSRVVFIEGVAPEGVDLGDRANYFNAEPAAGGMLVVSWTGPEMEFFKGHKLREKEVVQGFGLPRPNILVRCAEAFRRLELNLGQVVFAGVILFFVLGPIVDALPDRDPVFEEPAVKQAAPAVHLPDNASGRLGAHTYTVTARALVEVARQGLTFERYEYAVVDEHGGSALLVQELDNTPDDWALLLPASFAKEVTPYDLARARVGMAKDRQGQDMAVVYLFQSKVRSVEGKPLPERWPVETQYGFMGRFDRGWMLARWTENQVWVDAGKRYTSKEVADGFGIAGIAVK